MNLRERIIEDVETPNYQNKATPHNCKTTSKMI